MTSGTQSLQPVASTYSSFLSQIVADLGGFGEGGGPSEADLGLMAAALRDAIDETGRLVAAAGARPPPTLLTAGDLHGVP